MKKKVSIIIPVYKVEKYLEECVDSILAQTYKNLEIILIDDESPDHCPQICDRYAKKDSRVNVLHKKNGGAASARNMGLEIATGDYIGFIDSDDYVDKNYIKNLKEKLEESKADISVCAYANVYTNRVEAVYMEKAGIYTAVEFLERFLWDWKCGLLWNKLFKAELIKDIRFAEGHVIDDEFFTYQVVMNAKRIIISEEALVYYRQRLSGVMNQGKEKKMVMDRIEYYTERFEKVCEKYPEIYLSYFQNLVDNIIAIKREAKKYREEYKKIHIVQKKYLKKVLTSSLSYKIKIVYFLEFLNSKTIETKKAIDKNGYFE